jgi:hypothetical protein
MELLNLSSNVYECKPLPPGHSPVSGVSGGSGGLLVATVAEGLILVPVSAQRKQFLWDTLVSVTL